MPSSESNKWQVVITNSGKKDLDSLDNLIRRRILLKIKWFEENFQNVAPLPLDVQFKGFFKLRVGDWRIIYEIDYNSRQIIVYAVDNRDKIYK